MKAATFPVLGILVLSVFLAGCTSASADHVTLVTSEGCIIIELYSDDAPRTVENFVKYVQDGFYDGLIFHRIMPDFVIQGGGFTEEGEQKQPRAPIPLEYNLPNEVYTLSMARTPDPDSATSQFFINTKDNTEGLGPGGFSPDGYAVFGKVIEGTAVVDAIESHPTTTKGGHENWPQDPAPRIIKAVAGRTCEEPEEPAPVYGFEVGLIHDTQRDDGVWETNVSAAEDFVPVWLRNTGNQADTISVQSVQPMDWDVSFNPGAVELQRKGALRGGAPSDAATGYITIRYVGDDLEADTTDTRIRFTFTSEGDANETHEVVVRPILSPFGTVAKKGDQIEAKIRGTFDDGEEFQPVATYSWTVGAAGTIPGFAMGALGISVDEKVGLRFPPELGYGNNNEPHQNPALDYSRFNFKWLNFELHVQEVPTA